MYFFVQSIGLLGLLASLVLGNPECPNTLAFYNPSLRTTCYNATWFILPIPKASVQSLVPYPLITPPFSDKSLFPTGFPPNTHPVVVSTGYQNDIRMGPLQIESLLGASVYVPYTDRLRDGRTPFQYAVQIYIGGVNGKDVQALVPSLVGSLGGSTIFVASFDPNNDAYAPIASNPTIYTARVKQVIIPNPISGPEVKPEAFDLAFFSTRTPLYTEKTFHTLINQPQILNNQLLCQRNTYYFNETFAEPKLRTGNVTVYGPPAGALPTKLARRYVGQGGYSASGQMVGYNQESCESAAARTDPKALQ
ncbi:MAG: hypothetical protein L6R38_007004 [Xanthoria sp. 2 TBL-2021]|nr:MAG: hypothetical protein L6R38_007004 [Xanthoria sp. 2 TBL-2021]